MTGQVEEHLADFREDRFETQITSGGISRLHTMSTGVMCLYMPDELQDTQLNFGHLETGQGCRNENRAGG